jgi:hypothetical protein
VSAQKTNRGIYGEAIKRSRGIYRGAASAVSVNRPTADRRRIRHEVSAIRADSSLKPKSRVSRKRRPAGPGY